MTFIHPLSVLVQEKHNNTPVIVVQAHRSAHDYSVWTTVE